MNTYLSESKGLHKLLVPDDENDVVEIDLNKSLDSRVRRDILDGNKSFGKLLYCYRNR